MFIAIIVILLSIILILTNIQKSYNVQGVDTETGETRHPLVNR